MTAAERSTAPHDSVDPSLFRANCQVRGGGVGGDRCLLRTSAEPDLFEGVMQSRAQTVPHFVNCLTVRQLSGRARRSPRTGVASPNLALFLRSAR